MPARGALLLDETKESSTGADAVSSSSDCGKSLLGGSVADAAEASEHASIQTDHGSKSTV
jgi:hypothetical protein